MAWMTAKVTKAFFLHVLSPFLASALSSFPPTFILGVLFSFTFFVLHLMLLSPGGGFRKDLRIAPVQKVSMMRIGINPMQSRYIDCE